MEAKKLTETCYMVTDSYGNELGLAMIRDMGVLFTHDLDFYGSIEALAEKYNEKLFYTELPSSEDVVKEIGGYPIKHDVYCEEEWQDTHYVYKTREGSNVLFCAGWWVISTDSIHRAALSPKLSTVSDTSVGPFKSRFDCQAEVTRLNKEKSK